MENHRRLTPEEWEAEKALKLSKRLLYILRYGAEREGLKIYEGGKNLFIGDFFFSNGVIFPLLSDFPCSIISLNFVQ